LVISFNRNQPSLRLHTGPDDGTWKSADYCEHPSALSVIARDLLDPDSDDNWPYDIESPSICICRQQLDSKGRLIPSEVVLYEVLTIICDDSVDPGPALKLALGCIKLPRFTEDPNFIIYGEQLHPNLTGLEFYYQSRHLNDLIAGLDVGGRPDLARDLTAIDFAEKDRLRILKAEIGRASCRERVCYSV
jgi:hypothetical protein